MSVMAARQRVSRPSGPRPKSFAAAPASTLRAAPPERPLPTAATASGIIRLQRTVGNRVTIATLAHGPTLQRAPDVADTPASAAAASESKSGSSALDSAVQQRLEQFLDKFTHIRVTVKWEEKGEARSTVVAVHPPYFINVATGGSKKRYDAAMQAREGAAKSEKKLLDAAPAAALVGKSTPEELTRLLQAAVDQGKVPTPEGKQHPDADDLRAWLVKYGIGVDCSGFVSQALNDVVAGQQAGGAGPQKAVAPIHLPSAELKGGQAGFTQVARPAELRPGDTMWREGHIRIVTSARQTPEGLEFTTAESTAGQGDIGPTSAEWRYPDAQKFTGLEKRSGKKWKAATGEANIFGRYTALAQFENKGGAGAAQAAPTAAPTAASAASTASTAAAAGAASAAAPASTASVTTQAGPRPSSPDQAAEKNSTGWLKRAMEENARYRGRLGWAQRFDDIVAHLQKLGYLPPLQTPGEEGFAEAVSQFQQRAGLKDDGILGPQSWAQLSQQLPATAQAAAATGAAVAAAPAAGGDGAELSGSAWVSRFPTSRDIADLAGDFRGKLESFYRALTSAQAAVHINATYRPPERAFLMHWSYRIAREGYDPRRVPALAGVNINWWHGDAASSRAAAEAMVSAYDIAFRPALNSNHTRGTAIDMSIGWNSALTIADSGGRLHEIASQPKTGMNPQLWDVGASYGVIKHKTDRPHWSHDGR